MFEAREDKLGLWEYVIDACNLYFHKLFIKFSFLQDFSLNKCW